MRSPTRSLHKITEGFEHEQSRLLAEAARANARAADLQVLHWSTLSALGLLSIAPAAPAAPAPAIALLLLLLLCCCCCCCCCRYCYCS